MLGRRRAQEFLKTNVKESLPAAAEVEPRTNQTGRVHPPLLRNSPLRVQAGFGGGAASCLTVGLFPGGGVRETCVRQQRNACSRYYFKPSFAFGAFDEENCSDDRRDVELPLGGEDLHSAQTRRATRAAHSLPTRGRCARDSRHTARRLRSREVRGGRVLGSGPVDGGRGRNV